MSEDSSSGVPASTPASFAPDGEAKPETPAAPTPAAPVKIARPKNLKERIDAAEKLREEANSKFRQSDVEGAKKLYDEVLILCNPDRIEEEKDPDVREEEQKRAQACRVPTQLNLALCCLRIEPVEAWRALEMCEHVLDVEPDNVKAIFRKGKALVELEEFKEADWEFVRAIKLEPGNKAIRDDLDKLRKRLRAQKEHEKQYYEDLFKRNPGFASNDRKNAEETGGAHADGSSGVKTYEFQKDPAENPQGTSEKPHEEALVLQADGKLEEAVWAWEAALHQSKERAEWSAHFSHWINLARLYMDMNVDGLALRCLFTVVSAADSPNPPEGAARRHALLLLAICLLNEAEADPQKEVTAMVNMWFVEEAGPEASGRPDEPLEPRLDVWRRSGSKAGWQPSASADAAVAHGLLHVVNGGDSALQCFADALDAPVDEDSCFGALCRRSTKWNMLGAVLANRGRHEHALVAYEQALRLQPQYCRALNNQSIALQTAGNLAGGAAASARALKILPDWAAETCWPVLQKAAEDAAGGAEKPEATALAEAARDRNLTRVQELLGSAMDAPPSADVNLPVKELLVKCGLASGPAAA